MIRVLFITNYADMYGANRSMVDLILTLQKRYNVKATVLINGIPGELGEKLNENGIDTISSEFRITSIKCEDNLKFIHKLTRRIMRYKEYLFIYDRLKTRKEKFDIIHTNTSIVEIGYFLSRRLHIPHVWHIREFGVSDYGLDSIFSDWETKLRYRRSNIITISQTIDRYVKKRYGKLNTHQIYDDVSIVPPYDKDQYKDDKVRFVIVGSIRPQKGQFLVVEACGELIKRNIKRFEVHIVGDDSGNEAKQIKKFVKEHNLNDYIVFEGYKENVNDILKKMDCGITASNEEALGRVTIEYMANYMMPIGSKNGGTVEIIGSNGMLFDTGDISQLADCMQRYIFNRADIDKDNVIRREAAEEFSKGLCAQKVVELYKSCIEDVSYDI